MAYTYLIEEKGNKCISVKNSVDTYSIVYILCYHININSKYPFIQFLLEKTPFCSGLLEEQFILPSIIVSDSLTIEDDVLSSVKSSLLSVGCDVSVINADMYHGLINDSNDINYALVNISGIDINYLKIYRRDLYWFGLPSEIINTGHICNICISPELRTLFNTMPELSLVHQKNAVDYFIIPDAVYSGSEYKDVEFNSIFGMIKKQIYDSCSEYFYFFRNFNHAIKEGGWVKEGGIQLIDMNNKIITHSKSDRLLVDNSYGRYIKGGINRYALFVENSKVHFLDIAITDDDVSDAGCVILAYTYKLDIKPDILVKEYECFFPLSFHELDKSVLGPSYNRDNKSVYMIA